MLGAEKNQEFGYGPPLRKDVTDMGTKINFLQDFSDIKKPQVITGGRGGTPSAPLPQIHLCGSY